MMDYNTYLKSISSVFIENTASGILGRYPFMSLYAEATK